MTTRPARDARVGTLFDVVAVGDVAAYDGTEFASLPADVARTHRKAVDGRDIVEGRFPAYRYVAVGKGARPEGPVFVSGSDLRIPGSVVMEYGDVAALNGLSWTPTEYLRPSLSRGSFGTDVASAYLAVLNSATFASLSARQGEGRDVADMPMVDLAVPTGDHSPVRALAQYARRRYQGIESWAPVDDEGAERIVAGMFGMPVVPVAPPDMPSGAPSWIGALVGGGPVGTSRSERVEVLLKMDELAGRGDFGEIDAALAHAPVPSLSDTSMMTLLRGTFRFRERLAEWEPFRERVARELGARGAPVSLLLVGLYRKPPPGDEAPSFGP